MFNFFNLYGRVISDSYHVLLLFIVQCLWKGTEMSADLPVL